MARKQQQEHLRPVAELELEQEANDGTREGFAAEFRGLAQQRRFERAEAETPIADAAQDTPAPKRAARKARQPKTVERLSHDPSAALLELSRMADRVIEARDALAVERARADRAEHELQSMDERLLAARALVHEAQRTARIAAERCAFVEGRCEALEDALDLALNASIIQRWRWRRQLRQSD